MSGESFAEYTPHRTIGRGERVRVETLLGHEVVEGDVSSSVMSGLMVGRQYFAADRHRFVVVDSVEERPLRTLPPNPMEPSVEQLDEKDEPGDEDEDPPEKPAKPPKLASTPGKASLPDEVKNEVPRVGSLSDDQVSQVLRATGDAFVDVLRRIGVYDEDVYPAAAKVQDAARKVLE
tara:strand:+ start:8299 stop:8829 length:531 start_codon:yes stop_codon:yes gene_type:complete